MKWSCDVLRNWNIYHSTYKKFNNEKKQTKPEKTMDTKQNVNEYTKNESLSLNEAKTPMMENLKHAWVSET